MLTLSDNLRRRIFDRRMAGERLYQIARRADLHPSLVSHLVNGSKPIRRWDERVFRLAEAVGVPADQAIADDTEK